MQYRHFRKQNAPQNAPVQKLSVIYEVCFIQLIYLLIYVPESILQPCFGTFGIGVFERLRHASTFLSLSLGEQDHKKF